MLNQQHLTALDTIVNDLNRDASGDLILAANGWRGSECQSWSTSVTGAVRPHLPAARQTRGELVTFLQTAGLADEDAYLAIMAWGAQNRRNGRTAWAGFAQLAPIIDALRRDHVSAFEAYTRFHHVTVAHEPRVKGLGPAYYTKLLYFLSARQVAPIMDQWTAKSMQLLVARSRAEPIIKLSSQGYVSPQNTVVVYELFCSFVAQIAQRYEISVGSAEALAFSGSGQPWRDHVRAHWRFDA
jgi:hypothetical protein